MLSVTREVLTLHMMKSSPDLRLVICFPDMTQNKVSAYLLWFFCQHFFFLMPIDGSLCALSRVVELPDLGRLLVGLCQIKEPDRG